MRWTSMPRPARSLTALALFAFLLAVPAASAEEPAPPGSVEPGSEPVETTEPPPDDGTAGCCGINSGKIALSVGMDFTTAYFLRGILQERDGFIWQPYAGVTVTPYTGEGFLKSFSLNLGTWNSVHSNKTLASGSGPSNWYESDVIAGFGLGLGDYVTTNLSYVMFAFPNGAFPTAQELDWTTNFNDSEFLGAFALNPSMLWVFELDSTSFGDLDDQGVYLQLGVRPSYVFFEDANYPLTLALPLSVGLSVADYYEESGPDGRDQTFGFFDVGIAASVPLSFIPPEYGAWSATASVDMLALSGTLATANRGDGTFFVGKAGISFAY
jgi:hypothetical protein